MKLMIKILALSACYWLLWMVLTKGFGVVVESQSWVFGGLIGASIFKGIADGTED